MAGGGVAGALPVLLLLAAGALGKPTARQERARPGAAQHEDRPGFQYDHEAFLGKEEARSFDQLSPEESRERLGNKPRGGSCCMYVVPCPVLDPLPEGFSAAAPYLWDTCPHRISVNRL